jgi:hypothetical protein
VGREGATLAFVPEIKEIAGALLMGVVTCWSAGCVDPDVDDVAGDRTRPGTDGGSSGVDGNAQDRPPPWSVVDAGDGRSADRVTHAWGVSLHLVSEPPVAPDAPTGLHVVVTDQQATGELSVAVHWPAASNGFDPVPDGARASVLHPCGSPPDPLNVTIETCRSDDQSPGCLTLRFYRDGVSGAFTHPSGLRCDITGAQGEITLRSTEGVDWTTAEFRSSDVMMGWFDAPCVEGGSAVLRLDGAFQLPVLRRVLAC